MLEFTKKFIGLFILSMLIVPSLAVLPTSTSASRVHNAPSTMEGYSDPSNFKTYYTYDEMASDLEKLASDYPDICRLHKIGQTYEGRYLYAMKISDDPDTEDPTEPDVLIMGAHHAREWPSYEVVLYYIFYMLENYGNNSEVTWLVNNREIWCVPMVNPDGVEYDRSIGGGTWRKNREPNYLSETVGVGPLPDPKLVPISYGTDLNRNYGYRWGFLGGSDPHLSYSSEYPGPPDNKDDDGDGLVNEDPVDGIDNDRDGKIDEDPAGGFSTAETCAIRDLALAHDFQFSLSFHTYGQLVLWPWGWTTDPAPDAPYLERAGKIMGNMTGYTPEQGSQLYLTDGDSDDWLYAIRDVYAYTIEIGTQFIEPEDEIINYCKLNLGPQLFITREADNRKLDLPLVVPLDNPNSTENSTVELKAMVYDRGGILGASYQLPHIKGQGKIGMKLVYRVGAGGKWHTKDMDEYRLENGTLAYRTALPISTLGKKVDYYFSFVDPFGRTSTGPRYAPYALYSVEHRTKPIYASSVLLAMIVAVVVCTVIWGGFGLSVGKAMSIDKKKESYYEGEYSE